jgi:outer membrane protein assembly factor BamE
MRILYWLTLITIMVTTGACYKIDIPQGTIIEQEAVDRLTPGMDKRQVQALLGTPPITDPFNVQRWDYIYLFLPRGNENAAEKRRISLYFEGETLSRIEGDRQPPAETTQ